MTKIIVRREKALFHDLLRDYAVLVDGREVARVSNGAEVAFDVAPGKHTIQMKIDWCGSAKLEINPAMGETVILTCGPNGSIVLGILYISIWKNKYIWLHADAGK